MSIFSVRCANVYQSSYLSGPRAIGGHRHGSLILCLLRNAAADADVPSLTASISERHNRLRHVLLHSFVNGRLEVAIVVALLPINFCVHPSENVMFACKSPCAFILLRQPSHFLNKQSRLRLYYELPGPITFRIRSVTEWSEFLLAKCHHMLKCRFVLFRPFGWW